MLVMFRTLLAKPEGMSNADFYGAWLEEAEASKAAVEAGIIRAIYKVPGRDEVIGIIEVEDADALDRGINSLPLWRLGYSHVVRSIEWTLLRPYERWADDLRLLAEGKSLLEE
jgi:muconolactone delta-isomerase